MTEEERAYRASRDPAHLVEVDAAGRTQLHLAAGSGKAAVCRIYINAGCDPSARDNSGRTPAELASAAGYAALARWLGSLPAVADTSGVAAQRVRRAGPLDASEQRGLVSGDQGVIAAIMADGRLACRNAKGDTPLHLAAAGGHLTACNALYEAGADPAARNDAKQTPAEMAADAGHSELARLLGGPEPEMPAVAPVVLAHDPPHLVENDGPKSVACDPGLDLIEFDSVEDLTEYHARQGIGTVSAHFTAISPQTGMRSGGPEENEEWELPSALARVDQLSSFQRPASRSSDVGEAADFSHSAGHRRSRKPRKLRSTRFTLAGDFAREWAAEALSAGTVDEQAIRDLVGACVGNHDQADLETNVRKVLAAAGIHVVGGAEDFRPFPAAALDLVDVSGLSDAIGATCSRDTPVPGSGPFMLDRATEERILRDMGNARRDLLEGILNDPGMLAEIVRRGELVLAGELAPDELFTSSSIPSRRSPCSPLTRSGPG